MFEPHFNIVFLGGGGSILSEPGFRGKYSKMKHITCIFLNIFVQDWSSPGALAPSFSSLAARAPRRACSQATKLSENWAVSMAKPCEKIVIVWRVVGNVNVKSSSKCRPRVWVRVYGISVWTISPCLRQFDRCPSWLVHQWTQERFWVVLIPAIKVPYYKKFSRHFNLANFAIFLKSRNQ